MASLDAAGRVDAFLDLACLTYTPADSIARRRRAERLLEAAPEIVHDDLFAAGVVGDIASARRLLDADPSLATRRGGPRQWDALLYLCYGRVGSSRPGCDPLAVARLLLERGADPNSHVMLGEVCRFTALTGALGEGELGRRFQPPHPQALALARLLLDAGADPNDSQGLYNTMFGPSNQWLELLFTYGLDSSHRVNWAPHAMGMLDYLLGRAVLSGFRERVELLLAHGASADGHDSYNHRSHHENALLGGFGEIAALLERHGARPAELSERERFRAACMRGDADTARATIARHPEYREDADLVMDAAERGRADIVRLLLELGFSAGARDHSGATALHKAAVSGHLDAVRALVEGGAAIETRDRIHHGTPLGWAAYGAAAGLAERARPQEVIGYLLERAQDPHDLARHGQIDRLAALLGEDPALARASTPAGFTPLHAVRDDTPDLDAVIELLLRHGADPDARSGSGPSALEHLDSLGADMAAASLRRHAAGSG